MNIWVYHLHVRNSRAIRLGEECRDLLFFLRYSIARNIQNFGGFVLIPFIALRTCNYILILDYTHSFNLSIKK